MLLADAAIPAGTVIPNIGVDDKPNAAYQDPRTIRVVDALEERAHHNLVDIVLDDSQAVHVVRVEPCGPVAPHRELHQDAHAVPVEAHTPLQAEGGWVVRANEDLRLVLGPQGQQILDTVRTGIRVFERHRPGVQILVPDDVRAQDEAALDRIAEAYHGAMNALGTQDIEHFAVAAEYALDLRNADGYWLINCVSRFWGREILALAAQDLIGTASGWTAEAYDGLTRAWRTAFGQAHAPR